MDRDSVEPRVDELPGEHAREQVDYHHEPAAPSTYVYEFVWDHTAPAAGPFCTDVDGNVLMDFTAHVGAAPLGYDNPTLRERLDEFDLTDPTKIAGQDFYAASGPPGDAPIPGPADLMDRLVDVSDHYGMDTVFLSNSGAEAVENAIKICYDHTAGKYAITFEGAFHGRTLGALSLNRSKGVYRRRFPEISTVHDVPFCTDRTCDPGSCGCGFFVEDGSRLRRMLGSGGFVDPDEVAYVVVEPVQGEGGYRFPSDAFVAELAAVVDEHDLLLVADEIQSGMGRTGEFWASDHYPIEPDVIAGAKALRVGATIASEDVFPDEESRLSSTWGAGDLLACAQGAITIDVIREQGLMDNARERGRQFRETFDAGPAVTDVRGKGLMLAVEFDTKARRDDVMDAAFARGLLTLGCGRKTLRILPPLDATEREIDLGASLLADAVDAAS
ncbi:aminotransferase class III-fold pyridoxal phosphate-dependent enzyme [Halorientalis pallida]|uniref:Aminotransferase class III-fold pyridoxal phosphate-dependent enzyme n=1 Tax=Halorientalis pallida TaxID=2479928 RepID=A0A498L824_9EURY|nr:aminotransferase class III-fold pyridoxal phosphate-dependent enzyme [Halorientalis pallida]RXK51323.1 aminotransferase class III-fold pyridoxal phosphate-dependent enzyme [Halorientalis pallida]